MKFCLCQHAWISHWFHNKSCLLWWPASLSIRIQTRLNHIRFVLYHNIKDNETNLCWQLKTLTPTCRCARCIMQMSYLYASAVSFQELLQTRSTCRSNKKTGTVWEKSNEAYPLSIRVQTTKPHFDIFLSGMNVKKMFFSSEREFKKALRDTLMWAAWYELSSTMANCGKIVTFLCLGISIITWVIILKQLFASGSWILVNIHFALGE